MLVELVELVVLDAELVVVLLSLSSSLPPVGFCSVLEDSLDELVCDVLVVVRELDVVVT